MLIKIHDLKPTHPKTTCPSCCEAYMTDIVSFFNLLQRIHDGNITVQDINVHNYIICDPMRPKVIYDVGNSYSDYSLESQMENYQHA